MKARVVLLIGMLRVTTHDMHRRKADRACQREFPGQQADYIRSAIDVQIIQAGLPRAMLAFED